MGRLRPFESERLRFQRFQHCRAAPNCRVPAGVRQIRSLPGGTRHQSIVLPCGVSNFGVSNFGLAMRDDGASNHAKVEDASGNNGSPGIDLSGVRPAPARRSPIPSLHVACLHFSLHYQRRRHENLRNAELQRQKLRPEGAALQHPARAQPCV